MGREIVQAIRWELSLRHIVAPFVMNTEVKNERVHWTWFERLRMWRHAYETEIVDCHHEAVGRGPTPAAARDAALKRWNELMEEGRAV